MLFHGDENGKSTDSPERRAESQIRQYLARDGIDATGIIRAGANLLILTVDTDSMSSVFLVGNTANAEIAAGVSPG